MALTFANLKNHAQLDGDLSSAFDSGEVVNDAGRYLFAMHPWNLTIAPPVTLNFHADRDYAELPRDYGTAIEIVTTSGLTSSFSFTTPQSLVRMRSQSVTHAFQHYFGAVTFPAKGQPDGPVPPPRLELWPTPVSASSAVLTICYRRAWAELVDDTDVPDMDEAFNPLLRMLVRAFALGYDEDSLDERLTAIESNIMLKRLKEYDGMRQSDLGTLAGGALRSFGYDQVSDWRATASAADPS